MQIIQRLEKMIVYVAGNTRDQWAKEYLMQRLRDIQDSELYQTEVAAHVPKSKKDSPDAT